MGDRIVSRWSNLNGRYIGPIKKMRDKIYSIIDFNDHNNEYVIEDMQGNLITRITHYVINDGYADGDKIESYIENELDFDIDICIGGELFRVE